MQEREIQTELQEQQIQHRKEIEKLMADTLTIQQRLNTRAMRWWLKAFDALAFLWYAGFKDRLRFCAVIALRGVGVRKPLPKRSELVLELLDRQFAVISDTGKGALFSNMMSQGELAFQEHERGTNVSIPAMEPECEKSGVCYIAESYIGLMVDTLDKGGLENIVALLARGFTLRGLTVKVFCSLSGGAVADMLQEEGIEVLFFHGSKHRFIRYLRKNRPDIISAHYSRVFYEVPKALGIPIVETIQGMYAHITDWGEEVARGRNYNALIASSRWVEAYYIHHSPEGIPPIVTVPNAAEELCIPVERAAELKASLGIAADAFVFLHIGSFYATKNQLGLITAFNQFFRATNANAVLLLAGNTLDPCYRDRVGNYVKGLYSEDSIHILDYVPAVGDLLVCSDVFVIPSYLEGCSVAAIEAAIAGLPIIHTNCGNGPELCGRDNTYGILISNPLGDPLEITQKDLVARGGGCVPENTLQLMQALYRMYAERGQWAERREHIRARAKHMYDKGKMIDRYLGVFAGCKGERKKSSKR